MDFEIRKNRTPGAGRQVRERAAYFQLMEQGYSTRDAARIVGINLRTAKRWRNGRAASGRNKAAPPVNAVVPLSAETTPPAPSRYLSEAERIHIADRLREKTSVRQIVSELVRSPSMISREIRRNRRPTSEHLQSRPGSLVIAPHRIAPESVRALREAGARLATGPAGRAAGVLLAAARLTAGLSAAGQCLFRSRRWPRHLLRRP